MWREERRRRGGGRRGRKEKKGDRKSRRRLDVFGRKDNEGHVWVRVRLDNENAEIWDLRYILALVWCVDISIARRGDGRHGVVKGHL